jgi:predicted RNase H-like HicB family nuclease
MPNGEQKATSVTAIFFEENGGVTGFVEEFLEVAAHGRDLKEARARLINAIRNELENSHESVRQRAASYGTVTRECLFVEFRRR